MKVNRIVAYCILLLFLLYGLNSFIFERKLFFNELLSFIGLFLFFNCGFSKPFVVRLPKSPVFRLMLSIIGLGLIHLLTSLLRKTDFYYYFRNSAIVYSMFSFFIGFYLFPYAKEFFNKIRYVLGTFFGIAFIYPVPLVLMDRFTSVVFFPLLFKNSRVTTFFSVVIINIVYAVTYDSLTVIIITFFFGIIYFFRTYTYFKWLVVSVLIFFISFFIYLSPHLQKYKTNTYSLFGNMKHVYRSHPLLSVDGNSTWRAVFWYRITVERFPENILGIGMGTPLIPYKKGADTAVSDHNDEYDAHVTGVHNTFITLTVRMGILFLVLVALIYRYLFKEYFNYATYYKRKGYYLWFWSFFMITIVGLFNLLLESPTVASIYWIFLGFVAQITYQRKLEELEYSQP